MTKTLRSKLGVPLLGSVMAALALVVGLTVIPAAQAGAVTCRVETPKSAIYGGGRVSTEDRYVPFSSVSGCVDINVRNIRDVNNAADTCATFTVAMYPTSGGVIYGKSKFVCSAGPNGPVVPIATNVINGTKYRVLYNVETSHTQRHTFQIVD
jgi:hypothetical protein